MLYFYVNGRKCPVIVDNFFPCNVLKGKMKMIRPAFAKGYDGELWTMLLEKGWAKLHGSYYRTEKGFPSHAAAHMLGVPTKRIDHEPLQIKEDKLEEDLRKERQNKFF